MDECMEMFGKLFHLRLGRQNELPNFRGLFGFCKTIIFELFLVRLDLKKQTIQKKKFISKVGKFGNLFKLTFY